MHRRGLLPGIAGLVLLIGAIQLFSGALAAGVTWDEPHHVNRTEAWLETGWYVRSRFIEDGQPVEDDPRATPFVYGPGYSSIAHLANVAAGTETIGAVSGTESAYKVRHLVVAALGLLTAMAVGAMTWVLTRSPGIGLWTAAGLLAVPVWMGHSFFNVKDVPAAAGCTLITLGLVLALDPVERYGRRTSHLRNASITISIAFGIYVGVGTRPALWVFLATSLATFAVVSLGRRSLGGAGSNALIRWVVLGSALGLMGMAAVYPRAASDPVAWLIGSIADSSAYPWTGFTLTAGLLLPERPPWWYLPAWAFGSYPALLAFLAVLGTVTVVTVLIRRNGEAPRWRAIWSRRELGVVLVLQQALLLPVGAVVLDTVMYSGLRQHLYMVPALATLAGLGAHAVMRWTVAGRRSRVRVGPVVLSLALLLPMAEQTMLFPYNYTYVNPVAGIGGVNDRWETDYWGASFPEALSRVPPDADLRCDNWLVVPWDPDRGPDFDECAGGRYAPHMDKRGSVSERAMDTQDMVWVIGRKGNGNYPPPYCESVDDVTRSLRGEDVTMAFVLVCEPDQMP